MTSPMEQENSNRRPIPCRKPQAASAAIVREQRPITCLRSSIPISNSTPEATASENSHPYEGAAAQSAEMVAHVRRRVSEHPNKAFS